MRTATFLPVFFERQKALNSCLKKVEIIPAL
jgi:hypothetical protein